MANLLIRLRVIPIGALEDNYMYLVYEKNSRKAFAVDPVEPEKVLEVVDKEKVSLDAALITHHHWDHAGGNEKLRKLLPNVTIYGGDDRIAEMNKHVKDEETVDVAGLKVRCLSTPCHTKGHICYYIESENDRIVFTGDTLFIAGCGKFFEGDGSQMHRNLNTILSSLPDSTLVYPGHEYTTSNLKFALHSDPTNQDVKSKLEWSVGQDKKKEATVPSSIEEEKKINPFMRVQIPSIQKFTGKTDAVDVMNALRELKNSFKPNM